MAQHLEMGNTVTLTAKDIEKESSRLVRILENEYALEVKQKIKNREMER